MKTIARRGLLAALLGAAGGCAYLNEPMSAEDAAWWERRRQRESMRRAIRDGINDARHDARRERARWRR